MGFSTQHVRFSGLVTSAEAALRAAKYLCGRRPHSREGWLCIPWEEGWTSQPSRLQNGLSWIIYRRGTTGDSDVPPNTSSGGGRGMERVASAIFSQKLAKHTLPAQGCDLGEGPGQATGNPILLHACCNFFFWPFYLFFSFKFVFMVENITDVPLFLPLTPSIPHPWPPLAPPPPHPQTFTTLFIVCVHGLCI